MKSYPLLLALALATSSIAADWPHWGGGLGRNMINSVEKDLPASWDIQSGTSIKWVVKLGSLTYGTPIVADGRVYVGTNNEGQLDPKVTGDKGNIVVVAEKDGTLLWQAIHDKLTAGRVNDWPHQGICSSPEIVGDRLFYLSNRCEAICADVKGFTNGNQGMQEETYPGDRKADIIWAYDMIEELAAFPHNLATSSPLVDDGILYLITGNGVDEGHLNIPMSLAPSFVAFDIKTGELLWDFAVEDRILHGQWASGSAGVVKGQKQIYLPGGDGWLYAISPKGELIWKFNCNPPDAVWELGGYGTKNNLISTPVFVDGVVYIGVGQDPEHGTGIGHFYAIDAAGTGDITKTAQIWHRGGDNFGRTISTASVLDRMVYITDLAGILYCLDASDGSPHWTHDLQSAVWGSTMVVDNKVYIGNEEGKINVFAHSKTKKLLNTIDMGETVYSTPTAANGVLYITTKTKLYAIASE